MDTRTFGALTLRPTDNAQGGYYFYSLASGKRLHRTHWTPLPMPKAVKDWVHALARRANADKGLMFTDSDGQDLDAIFPEDNDDSSNYDPSAYEQSYTSDEDSNYEPSDTDSNTSDSNDDVERVYAPIVPPTGEAGNRDNAGVANADDTDDASSASDEDIETENPGVNDDECSEPTGVAHLEEFVEGLEAKLDDKIADLDSNYDPNDSKSSGDDTLEENLDEINQDRVDGLPEQTIADPDNDNSDDAGNGVTRQRTT
jgi:hypothetical protein